MTFSLDPPERENSLSMADYRELVPPSAKLFPDGRTLFYEGDDPEGFAAELIERYGLDPAAHPTRETPNNPSTAWTPPGLSWADAQAFHCPPEHLDDICDRYPVGT